MGPGTSQMVIRARGGGVEVADAAGAVRLRLEGAPYRLGEAMDLLATVNSLRDGRGVPLHALARDGEFCLWSCWQTPLFLGCLQPFLQYRTVFRWLEAEGWPRLDVSKDLPAELARCLRLAGVLHAPRGEGSRGKLVRAAARLALPPAWARSARARGARTLFYTSDIISDARHACDFRFAKVHDWARAANLPFSEIFHLADPRQARRNAWRRRRLPLYLELWSAGAAPALPDLDMAGLEPDLRSLLRRVLPGFLARCEDSRVRIAALRRWLRRAGIRLLVSMDDFRSNNELLVACRREGVRTVLVQHGLLTRFHPGWVASGIPEEALAAPDRFLVRGPFWKAVLERYAPRLARVAEIVSGLDAPAEETPALPLVRAGESVDVLFLAETLWDPAEAAAFLRRMEADPRVRVHFKIRPDLDEAAQLRPYFGNRRPHSVVRDLAGAREAMDVVVGSHSSLLYKLLEWGKPVFRLATSFEYGEQLEVFGLADRLGPGEDPYARFREALARGPEAYAERFRRYAGPAKYPDYAEILSVESNPR